MHRRLWITFVCTVTAGSAAAQTPRADFSGTWTQDTSRTSALGGGTGNRESAGGGRGGGLGLGTPADELVITQTLKMLTISERRGTVTTRVVYALDGARQTNTVASGRNTGASARYVTAWKDAKLETRITMPAAPGSRDSVEYVETRYLDADGSLIVETTRPGQTNMRRLVYVRRAPD